MAHSYHKSESGRSRDKVIHNFESRKRRTEDNKREERRLREFAKGSKNPRDYDNYDNED